MLRVIPKHKGTEHLQADIKARIKDLTDELEHGPKGGSRSGPALVVRPEGAAQIALHRAAERRQVAAARAAHRLAARTTRRIRSRRSIPSRG